MTRKEQFDPHPTTGQLADVYRYLERREWELWSIALLVMTILAGGVLVYFYQTSVEGAGPFGGAIRYVWVILSVFIGFVVLVNVYLIEKKRALASLWRRVLLQQEQLEQEREKVTRDPLTQAYSRRFFDEIIDKEIRRCDRNNRPLSFLFVDVDGFKKINERHGHLVGDEALRGVADVMQDVLRASDYAFRFGGDEFVVALPETPLEGAAVAARRLREKLAKQESLQALIGSPLTVSIGQALYARGQDLDALLGEAERAAGKERTT